MNSTQVSILAIDSSTSILRVGLSLPDGSISSLEHRDHLRHAEFIFGLIEDLLSRNGLALSLIKAIVVGLGPGSFTGLRVGMAASKGLATALKIPIVGVSTYAAIAEKLYIGFGPTAVLIKSRRDEYYWGVIDSSDFDNEQITVVGTDKLKNGAKTLSLYPIDFDICELGSSAPRVIGQSNCVIKIDDFIAYGRKKLETAGADDIMILEPLYIQKFPARAK